MKGYPLIAEARNLSIGYKGKRGTNAVVHSGINFSLHGGELVCLLGANGVGKSTLLRTMAAVQPALVSDISLMGRPCQSYSERERSRLIGIVLTERTHAGGLTVRELVALGRQPYTGFFGRLNKADEEKIDYAIQAVGMCNKAGSYVAELSDGERQKAMIAKALVQECPLILLDEPTAFLDVVSRIEIMTLLHKLAVEEGRAILLSTHDVEQALVLADKLWLLSKESGLVCGNTEDLILSNAMDKLFPHEEICFDLLHGGYSPVVHGDSRYCFLLPMTYCCTGLATHSTATAGMVLMPVMKNRHKICLDWKFVPQIAYCLHQKERRISTPLFSRCLMH